MVALVSDVNYSGTASGTLVIGADPFMVWREAHFSVAEIVSGLAANSMDVDGDGLSNLLEYILGTDPHRFSPQPLTVTSSAASLFSLTFVARRAALAGYEGLTRKYIVEVSSGLADPGSWQPVSGYTTLVGSDQTSDIIGEDQTVTLTLPATPANQFYRLNVRLE